MYMTKNVLFWRSSNVIQNKVNVVLNYGITIQNQLCHISNIHQRCDSFLTYIASASF